MPQIVGDEMVVLSDDDKKMIRTLGYKECAEILGKSPDYLRGLCSKGERRMRQSDVQRLRRES